MHISTATIKMFDCIIKRFNMFEEEKTSENVSSATV